MTVESPRLQIVEGVLHGDRPELECIWLAGFDGRITFIELPDGWSASFDPLILIDDQGREIVREGDHVRARTHEFEMTIGETLCGPGVPVSVETFVRVED